MKALESGTTLGKTDAAERAEGMSRDVNPASVELLDRRRASLRLMRRQDAMGIAAGLVGQLSPDSSDASIRMAAELAVELMLAVERELDRRDRELAAGSAEADHA